MPFSLFKKKDKATPGFALSPPPVPLKGDRNKPLPTIATPASLGSDSAPQSRNSMTNSPPKLSPLRPPRIDTASPPALSLPQRRTLSERVRSSPASLVRQLRVYSNSFSSYDNPNTDALSPRTLSITSSINGTSLLAQNRVNNENLAPELAPIVNLINAHKLRTYAIGTVLVPTVSAQGTREWIEADAKLTGNELAIWFASQTTAEGDEYDNDEFKPKYINLADSTVKLNHTGFDSSPYQLAISHDYDSSTVLRFLSEADYSRWVAAIEISNFETISLNEAFTAVILSMKASKFSDIHILLSHKKRFSKFEWCNLRLPQISSKWMKVYLAIIPSDSKKYGRIEIYSSEKVSKKNLILYVPVVNSVFNMYPEQANMIDFNSIMKVSGEIYVNKNYEYLFVHNDGSLATAQPPPKPSFTHTVFARSDSSGSLSSMAPPANGNHLRQVSSSSTTSFFMNAPSPQPLDTNGTRSRSSSTSSNTTKFIKKNINDYVVTDYMYLMPVPPPGVSAVETMLRNFLDMIDAFKLYGRPEHLIPDKKDSKSLLFGLPSLPHYEYLSMNDAIDTVKKNLHKAKAEDWDQFQWRQVFKEKISQNYSKGNFKGSGNIIKLYNSLELDANEISIESPRISMPDYGSVPVSPIQPLNRDGDFAFDNFSENIASPTPSEQNLAAHFRPNQNGSLGDPIDLSSFSSPQGLEPIADMPTPIDESHPYQNLVATNGK